MKNPSDRTDSDILNLDGGLFGNLKQAPVPLDLFRLHDIALVEPPRVSVPVVAATIDVSDQATTQVMKRVQLDSFAPVAFTESVPPPAPTEIDIQLEDDEPVLELVRPAKRRAVPWAFAAGVAVGVGAILAMGLVSNARPKGAPEAAQAAMVQAPMEAQAAAVPAPVPQTPVAEAPVKAEPAQAKEPIKAASPAPVKEPSKAPVSAPIAKAPAAPVKAAPEPASTADLPMELPVIPALPKAPEVAFNRSAAAVAIAGAGIAASSCKEDKGSMSIPVSVTFAPSGRATRVLVTGGPLAGTAAGSCVASAVRGINVPSFDGEPVTVNTSLHLR